MSLRISRVAYADMLEEAAGQPGREVCGLLLGSDSVERIVPTANVAADPETRFEIEPAALFAAIRTERAGGEQLIGYYHSHPSGLASPSEHDRIQALGDVRLWAVVAEGKVTVWRMTGRDEFERVGVQIVD